MSFTGNENHEISFEESAVLTKKYRDEAPCGALKALFFGKNAIQQLLDQDGSVGIRIYFGLNEAKIQTLVIVGVDEDENDQINDNAACMDNGRPCPSRCGSSNILNS